MFNTIGGMEFPLTPIPFFMCVELEFDPLEGGKSAKVLLRLIDEDGKELMGVEGQFVVPQAIGAKPVTLFQSFKVEHLVFPKPGHYRLDIVSDGETLGEARLYLERGQPPAALPPN
jgi:hypothetical protein